MLAGQDDVHDEQREGAAELRGEALRGGLLAAALVLLRVGLLEDVLEGHGHLRMVVAAAMSAHWGEGSGGGVGEGGERKGGGARREAVGGEEEDGAAHRAAVAVVEALGQAGAAEGVPAALADGGRKRRGPQPRRRRRVQRCAKRKARGRAPGRQLKGDAPRTRES